MTDCNNRVLKIRYHLWWNVFSSYPLTCLILGNKCVTVSVYEGVRSCIFNTASSCKLPLNFKFKIDMETTYANARTSSLLYFSLLSIKMVNWILETFNDHTYLEASRRYQVNQLDLRTDYVERNGITRKMLQQIFRPFKSSVEQLSLVMLFTLLLFSSSLQDGLK